VTTNDDHLTRGSTRLAAQEQSIAVPERRSADLPAQHGELMPEDNDLEFLEFGRPEQQSEKL